MPRNTPHLPAIMQEGSMDPESLEVETDRGINALSERIGLLKQVHWQTASRACIWSYSRLNR